MLSIRSIRHETNPIPYAVAANVVVNVGDVMVNVSNLAVPASQLVGTMATLVAAQEAVHDGFIGISLDKHRSNEPAGKVMCQTTGRYQGICTTLTAAAGALIGCNCTNVTNQWTPNAYDLIGVATANLAIGRLTKACASASTCEIEVVSTTALGGPQNAE